MKIGKFHEAEWLKRKAAAALDKQWGCNIYCFIEQKENTQSR